MVSPLATHVARDSEELASRVTFQPSDVVLETPFTLALVWSLSVERHRHLGARLAKAELRSSEIKSVGQYIWRACVNFNRMESASGTFGLSGGRVIELGGP